MMREIEIEYGAKVIIPKNFGSENNRLGLYVGVHESGKYVFLYSPNNERRIVNALLFDSCDFIKGNMPLVTSVKRLEERELDYANYILDKWGLPKND